MNLKCIQRKIVRLFFLSLLINVSAFPWLAKADEIQQINNDKELFLQAVELSEQKQWLQAEPIYRELIDRNKSWPEPRNNLAVLLVSTNRLNEASELFKDAINSSEGYRVSQENRSRLYNFLATKAYDKALGENISREFPIFELIKKIYQPVKTIKKQIAVEKPVVVEPVEIDLPGVGSKKISQANSGEDINQLLLGWAESWARSWTQGDFNTYIQYYSKNFTPSDKRKNYSQWKNIRRGKLKFTKNVKVNIDQLRVFVEVPGKYALVEFIQNYQSATYHDSVLKQMYVKKQNGSWLILSERIIKNY